MRRAAVIGQGFGHADGGAFNVTEAARPAVRGGGRVPCGFSSGAVRGGVGCSGFLFSVAFGSLPTPSGDASDTTVTNAVSAHVAPCLSWSASPPCWPSGRRVAPRARGHDRRERADTRGRRERRNLCGEVPLYRGRRTARGHNTPRPLLHGSFQGRTWRESSGFGGDSCGRLEARRSV